MPQDKDWKQHIPVPVFEEHPEYNDLYWKAWELAHDHIKDIPGMPQTPYMDEAFCDTDIWIWDSCFMSLFCKYASKEFPGVQTLNNFYKVLHDDYNLPKIITQNAPAWTGETIGCEAQMKIHIADNPPLFAWAEYENALMSGDKEHIKDLLLEKQYLQKHFIWLESLEAESQVKKVRGCTCLIHEEKGYLWEGGRSGMDNTPRGRTGPKALKDRPNNPDMYWIDALAQQGLAALCISKLADLIEESEMAAKWQRIFEDKKALINDYYWDDTDKFYYDIDRKDMDFIKIKTPASYWPLTASMANTEQAEAMSEYIDSPNIFGGEYPWVSLSRDDADFNIETGEYWRGSIWLPTAYAGLKGLQNYGHFETARNSALKLINQMYKTFANYSPHTIWECYNPAKPEPARSCDEGGRVVRPDFCGWSALGPISIYIENVIGIYSINAFDKTVKWRLPVKLSGKIGIKNLSFGDVNTDLIVDNQICEVHSNQKYTLLLNGKEYSIMPGSNSFEL